MAQNRWVSTNFWKDTYVTDLDPIEKLLFLYLLTNPRTNIAGIYEVSIREIAFDTGIDKDMVTKIIERFQRDKKVYYSRSWVTLLNWLKHQTMNQKIAAGIETVVKGIPQWYREELKELLTGSQQLSLEVQGDSLSKPMDSLSSNIHIAGGILFNSILFNLILFNSIAAEPQPDSKKFEQKKQKSYADAVREDEALAERAKAARNRTGSTKSIEEVFG